VLVLNDFIGYGGFISILIYGDIFGVNYLKLTVEAA